MLKTKSKTILQTPQNFHPENKTSVWFDSWSDHWFTNTHRNQFEAPAQLISLISSSPYVTPNHPATIGNVILTNWQVVLMTVGSRCENQFLSWNHWLKCSSFNLVWLWRTKMICSHAMLGKICFRGNLKFQTKICMRCDTILYCTVIALMLCWSSCTCYSVAW